MFHVQLAVSCTHAAAVSSGASQQHRRPFSHLLTADWRAPHASHCRCCAIRADNSTSAVSFVSRCRRLSQRRALAGFRSRSDALTSCAHRHAAGRSALHTNRQPTLLRCRRAKRYTASSLPCRCIRACLHTATETRTSLSFGSRSAVAAASECRWALVAPISSSGFCVLNSTLMQLRCQATTRAYSRVAHAAGIQSASAANRLGRSTSHALSKQLCLHGGKLPLKQK